MSAIGTWRNWFDISFGGKADKAGVWPSILSANDMGVKRTLLSGAQTKMKSLRSARFLRSYPIEPRGGT